MGGRRREQYNGIMAQQNDFAQHTVSQHKVILPKKAQDNPGGAAIFVVSCARSWKSP